MTDRSAKKFETLLHLTARLTEDRPLEDFLNAVTDACIGLVGDHASIRLLDTSRSMLLCGARSGEGGDNNPIDFRRGEGLIGWVVEHGQGVNVGDALEDPRYVPRGQQGFNVKSLMAEPLWASGEVVGVLAVSSANPQAFGSEDQLMLRLLANCSAPPIERARLRRLAMYDDTTMAFNHRYLVPRIVEEMERATRSGGDLSVLDVDLDLFKSITPRHGDEILSMFADRVRRVVRRIDILVRHGDDEFMLLMPLTGATQAHATSQRILQSLGQEDFELESNVRVRQTVSIGIATWDHRAAPEQLVKAAKDAMTEAKRLGRNRIVVST